MKFTSIDLAIPDEIINLVLSIREIEPSSILAGGFLSDLYMGLDYKDIDIFIKYDPEHYTSILSLLKIIPNSRYTDPSKAHYFTDRLVDIQSIHYKGFEVQLIFTNLGADIVNHFDFRFREFYTDGRHIYASVDGLEDIKERQLVFGSTDNPLGSFKRLMRFEERYGFEVETTSFNQLKAYFNAMDYTKERVETISFSEFPSIAKASLQDILSRDKMQFTEPSLRLDKANYCLRHALTRDDVVPIFTKNDFFTDGFFHVFETNYFTDLLNEGKTYIKKEVELNRMRLLTVLTPQAMKKLQFALKSMTTADVYTIQTLLRVKNWSYSEELKKAFYQFFYLLKNHVHFEPDINVTFSDDIYLHLDVSIDDYLHNRLIKCRINLPGSTTYSNLIFNHETGEAVYSLFDQVSNDVFIEIISEKLKAKRIA